MNPEHRATVLVVEDEAQVASVYEAWLSREYDVRVALDGEAALQELDDSIDVVLLDRRMPGASGDDILELVRERALDVRVSMVTAVAPDFDIIEMGFDDYLEKPVTSEELYEVVERLLRVDDYDAELQEYFSLVSKQAALAAEKSGAELERSEEYQSLLEAIETARSDLDDLMAGLHREDFDAMFRGLALPDDGQPVAS